MSPSPKFLDSIYVYKKFKQLNKGDSLMQKRGPFWSERANQIRYCKNDLYAEPLDIIAPPKHTSVFIKVLLCF